MILLDSLYINNSGGKVLLDFLIAELQKTDSDVFYLLDERCIGSYPDLPADKTLYLKASLKNRHVFYKTHKDKFNSILCFANLPPTIRVNATVYTYFHNLLLVDQPKGYPVKSKIKAYLKGLVIRKNKSNTDYFIVQSDNVKSILINYLNLPEEKCLVIPFFREIQVPCSFENKQEGFIYISNGNAHKNHVTLLKAWEILYSRNNLNLPLHLTVTESYPKLLASIQEYKNKGMEVHNHGMVDVKDLYSRYKYSIYPSLIESFGLGLIEAIDTHTEVIAADLPYVHAVIAPLATFNPHSAESIADTIFKVIKENSNRFVSKRKTTNQIAVLIHLIQEKTF